LQVQYPQSGQSFSTFFKRKNIPLLPPIKPLGASFADAFY